LTGIGVNSLQEALAAYFGPFQGGEKFIRKFLQTLLNVLILYLQRLEYSDGQPFKHYDPIQFGDIIDLTAFTEPKCCAARYQLTGLINHMGPDAHGHYVAFSHIHE
jgi:hypothetical protein